MTLEDLDNLLRKLSASQLHQIAKGRIPRHFRMGKQRLILTLLNLPSSEHQAIRAEIQQYAHTQSNRKLPPRPLRPVKERHVNQKRSSSGTHNTHSSSSLEPMTTLEELLEGIGVPPSQPLLPDPWQEEAIARLEESDVIVSVPTGSGKTYVAIQAIRQAISTDRTIIYTSPLKALSNTKLTEFSHIFGSNQVGILTGDRQDNPHAPILIMTTEILRNLLYDAACGEIDMRLDTLGLVIMDESQYLADPERGVVWEETIIFCPSQAKLLLLSASIGNPDEVANWMSRIRPTPCHLVQHRNRSVPLRGVYLHPSRHFSPLFTSKNISSKSGKSIHPETKKLFALYEEDTLGGRHRR
jgi:superfamily II RNA helicase